MKTAALNRLIEDAVRQAAGRPHAEQARTLQDCYDCNPAPQIKRELQRLVGLIDFAEAEFAAFESTPDEDQI